jgi:hypothetical protein
MRALAHAGHYWLVALWVTRTPPPRPAVHGQSPPHTHTHPTKRQLYSVEHTIRMQDVRPYQRAGFDPPTPRIYLNFTFSVVLVLNQLSTMPWRHMGKWRNSSTIVDLGIRWRWVVSFTPRSLYYRRKSPRYPLGGWMGPRAGLDVVKQRKIFSSYRNRTEVT